MEIHSSGLGLQATGSKTECHLRFSPNTQGPGAPSHDKAHPWTVWFANASAPAFSVKWDEAHPSTSSRARVEINHASKKGKPAQGSRFIAWLEAGGICFSSLNLSWKRSSQKFLFERKSTVSSPEKVTEAGGEGSGCLELLQNGQ